MFVVVGGEVAYTYVYHHMFDWQLIRTILFLFLPAMVANSAPIVAHRTHVLLWLNKPIDFGLFLGGRRIFGDNKTIRGYIVGVSAGVVVGLILFVMIQEKPYDSFLLAVQYSAATSFGALAGDSMKSFIKRRVGIAPGALWIPFDQIDYALGAILAALFFIDISFTFFLVVIIFLGCASFISSLFGFALHIKKNL